MTMNDDFIEQQITGAVWALLLGRVNQILMELKLPVPVIEYGEYSGAFVTVPLVILRQCERTEKERIICIDAFTLEISFNPGEKPETERYCYAYSAAVSKAIKENPTLGGVVETIRISWKRYVPPLRKGGALGWGLILELRATVEEK